MVPDPQQKSEANLRLDADRLRAELEALDKDKQQLLAECNDARETIQRLKQEVSLLEENLEDISYGLYRPHFTYESSEQYKAALTVIRGKQKESIRSGTAAICQTVWSVGGSEKEGQRMTKQYQKLLLRAFNGEAEAAICNVTWSNFRIMEQRIRKAYEAINKLGAVMYMSISQQYCDLRLEELRLAFECQERKQQEREEQRRLRAQMREEERVQRELAKEREDAENEEMLYERALEKARREAVDAVGAERDEFAKRVAELEQQLQEAHAKKERAIAQAQLTKMGNVYIISNIGSFGDQVYKIGMTRRRDPGERIKELGDASVPFPFDVHGLIHSENAPELECAFHTHFWERRINRANDRKEFFRITLNEIQTFARQRGLTVELTQLAEAKEYRQTIADSTEPETASIALAQ